MDASASAPVGGDPAGVGAPLSDLVVDQGVTSRSMDKQWGLWVAVGLLIAATVGLALWWMPAI